MAVRTYWILRTELEFQSVGLVHIDRICVENFQIKEPFFEAFSGDERYSRGQIAMDLRERQLNLWQS